MHSLEVIYGKLKDPLLYKKAVRKRIAKIILGSSVIRAFQENTKPALFNCLLNLDVDTLITLKQKRNMTNGIIGKSQPFIIV